MKPAILLSRDRFREAVFARDNHQCVICGADGPLDAHHIIERRLWTAPHEYGGYFLDNGASLCPQHHIQAEQTTLSCREIRERAGITRLLLPEHLYRDQEYDKCGNLIQPNQTRLRGELFDDESVQKALAAGGVLPLFVDYVKYPRTYHLPWSHGTSDDKILPDVSGFVGREVVVTEKMDGENTTLYRDHIHARSLELLKGEDRAIVKAIWSGVAHEIPAGWRVCGENLRTRHSILYTHLSSYLMIFSIWNERNECLSWDDTVIWTELLGLQTVPVLYRGLWNEPVIRSLFIADRQPDRMEGYVVRFTDTFSYADFKSHVATFTWAGHFIPNKYADLISRRIISNTLLPSSEG